MKTEICVKLDEFRVYYTTLTYKEAEMEKLEARCIEALAYDDRLKSWLEKLDEQIREFKLQRKTKRCKLISVNVMFSYFKRIFYRFFLQKIDHNANEKLSFGQQNFKLLFLYVYSRAV